MGNPPKPLRFPTSSRLKSSATIRRIVAEGRRCLRQGFSAHWLAPSESGDIDNGIATQFAFVVSRHSGAACVRNRIKRRLHEAARLNQELWPARTSVVLRAKGSSVAKLPFDALKEEMKQALQRIGESGKR